LHRRAGVAVYSRILHNAAMKTRKLLSFLAATAAAVAVVACTAPSAPPPFKVVSVNVPTLGAATSPKLAKGPDDRVLLSWLQTDSAAVALNYSPYADGTWGAAKMVSESEDMFVNWADLPSVVPLADGRLAAHWMVLSGAHSHAYDIAFSESEDNGETWSTATTPHTDGTDTEHGFVSIYSYEGETGLLWLDGRKMVNEVTDDPVASGMTLRSDKQLVDELICDCCQTDVAIASSGPVAVYRDRSVDEIRDIYITRLIDGRWQSGIAVAKDGWEIWGCPVNGPSIAADGDRVAVVWFTAAEEPLVQLAISVDSGETFSAPVEIVRSETLGRAAIALLDDGAVAVSWLESTESGDSQVKLKRVNADGSAGPVRVIANSASAFSVPQMLRRNSDLVFAWTQSDNDEHSIKSARVAIDSL
jgi:hypothetical protein